MCAQSRVDRSRSQGFRLANVLERTLSAAFVIDRWWELARLHEVANGLDRRFDLLAQGGCDLHLPPAARTRMIDRPVGHGLAGHFLKTHRLSGKLQVIVVFLTLPPVLEFHRVNPAIEMEFDDVGPARESQAFGIKRQRSFYAHARHHFIAWLVYLPVHRVSAHGMDVVCKLLLDVDECKLARALGIVLQGRDEDGIIRQLISRF